MNCKDRARQKSRRAFLKRAGITAGGIAAAPFSGFSKLSPSNFSNPTSNVLLIVIDDMNDWTSLLSDTTVRTPNLERLAKRSMVFTRAYCPAPACCPSRTSFLTGLRPSTSGVYFNNQSYRDAGGWLRDVVNLPQHFKANGFLTGGYGKIFHGGYQDRDAHSWTDGYYAGQESESRLYEAAESVTKIDPVWPYSWGMLPDDWDREDTNLMQQDTRNALSVSELVQTAGETRFFAALVSFGRILGGSCLSGTSTFTRKAILRSQPVTRPTTWTTCRLWRDGWRNETSHPIHTVRSFEKDYG